MGDRCADDFTIGTGYASATALDSGSFADVQTQIPAPEPNTFTDSDGDGYTDEDEADVFGTDPGSRADYPRPSLGMEGGEAVLDFPVDDRGYRIERSEDLEIWTDMAGAPLEADLGYVEPSGTPGWEREIIAVSGQRGFFRIRRRDRREGEIFSCRPPTFASGETSSPGGYSG